MDPATLPLIEPPYFDEELGACVLTRHGDVLSAMRSSSLAMDSREPVTDETIAAMRKIREETIEALSSTQLRAWLEELRPLVEQNVATLPNGIVVDLVDDYLMPCCLELAVLVTGIDANDAIRLRELARPVSEAAAEPCDDSLRAQAKIVTPQLQACFHAQAESLRDSGFVALSHTLPAMLANGCYSLLRHPGQWTLLHRQPELVESALEELIRYAGLSRYLKRRATEDVVLSGVRFRKGDRLILRIIAANHDPERFACPHQLDVLRRDAGHLALGAGPHACVGANLIRMASAAIMRPLLQRFSFATLSGGVNWRGGSGFRAPLNLPVILSDIAAS